MYTNEFKLLNRPVNIKSQTIVLKLLHNDD